jgi:segregation and condensation protein A
MDDITHDTTAEEQQGDISHTEAPQVSDRILYADARVGTLTIKTPVFEGPLEILLNLIEKRKLLINDISLSKVTDEYVEYINTLPEYSLTHRAQFILIASTLLLIKAKSLLPTLELTPEEQGDIKELQSRLQILDMMRKQSMVIKQRFGRQRIFERGDLDELIKIFAPGKDITAPTLTTSIYAVLNALPKKQVEQKALVKKVMSLEEMMDTLAVRIQQAMKMSFRDFSSGGQGSHGTRIKTASREERVHVIVSFLAMLELVKQGSIDVQQEALFEEIEIEKHDIGVPHYI